MRLLLINTFYPSHRGGLEIVAGRLAHELARRGVDVTWMADGAPPAEAAAVDSRLTCHPVRAFNGLEARFGIPWPVWSPGTIRRLVRRAGDASVLHAHDCLYFSSVAALVAARWWRRPILLTQHIDLVPYANPLLRGLMALLNQVLGRLVLGRADAVVFCSAKVRAYFEGFVRFRRAPLLIPNGLDARLFTVLGPEGRSALRERLRLGGGRRTVLFVGRYVEKKGLHRLRALAAALPEVDFVCAGSGPLAPAAWGLANVRDLGSQPQEALVPYYQAADLLALPSVGEGFPLVVQEAMSCGTPALVSPDTAAGDPRALPWLVTSSLEPAALLAATRHALAAATPARRAEIAAAARTLWSWEATTDAYEAILSELAGQSARPPAARVSLKESA